MARKSKETMRFIPALYSKPNIFKISIQSGMVCGCVNSKSLFYLFIIYVCTMYVLK